MCSTSLQYTLTSVRGGISCEEKEEEEEEEEGEEEEEEEEEEDGVYNVVRYIYMVWYLSSRLTRLQTTYACSHNIQHNTHSLMITHNHNRHGLQHRV